MRDGGVIDGEDGLWSLVGRGNGVANSDTSEVDSVMVGFLNGRFMSVEHAAGMSYLRPSSSYAGGKTFRHSPPSRLHEFLVGFLKGFENMFLVSLERERQKIVGNLFAGTHEGLCGLHAERTSAGAMTTDKQTRRAARGSTPLPSASPPLTSAPIFFSLYEAQPNDQINMWFRVPLSFAQRLGGSRYRVPGGDRRFSD